MPILSILVITILILLLLAYLALWIRLLGWVLRKAGYGEVSWKMRVGIFVCGGIAGALFNRVPYPLGADLPIVIVSLIASALIEAVLFIVVVRFFLGGAIISKQTAKAYLWYLVASVVFVVPVSLSIIAFRTYIVAPFQMNGQAMIPTLKHEEYIIVNKWGDTYKRGDIAVFEAPLVERYYYVERIVGLPGETVIFDGTRIMIRNAENPEGFALNEPYLNCPQGGCSYSNMSKTQFDIPEGSYFVMGDNRMNSTDSRFCFSTCSDPDATPFLPMQNMVGKVMGVMWPFKASKMIVVPKYSLK